MNNLALRNFETSKLQVRHVDLDCYTPDAERLPYIRVNLTERKGWQNHAEKNEGVVRGNFYSIHIQLFLLNRNNQVRYIICTNRKTSLLQTHSFICTCGLNTSKQQSTVGLLSRMTIYFLLQ